MTWKTITLLSTLALGAALAQSVPAAPASVNTAAEKAAWTALMSRDGEYVAYATYDAVLKKFGNVEPYATILRSEAQHIAALKRQLERYGVTVPANPYLGKVKLPADLKTVARTEVESERRNAALYNGLMAGANGDAQLQRVFTNLQRASRDVHLPLFAQAAAGNGTLTAADLNAFHSAKGPGANGPGTNGPGANMAGMNGPGANRHGAGMAAGMGLGPRGQGMGQPAGADCPMDHTPGGPGRGPGGGGAGGRGPR